MVVSVPDTSDWCRRAGYGRLGVGAQEASVSTSGVGAVRV